MISLRFFVFFSNLANKMIEIYIFCSSRVYTIEFSHILFKVIFIWHYLFQCFSFLSLLFSLDLFLNLHIFIAHRWVFSTFTIGILYSHFSMAWYHIYWIEWVVCSLSTDTFFQSTSLGPWYIPNVISVTEMLSISRVEIS